MSPRIEVYLDREEHAFAKGRGRGFVRALVREAMDGRKADLGQRSCPVCGSRVNAGALTCINHTSDWTRTP